MQRLEVSGAVRPIYGSLDVKRLIFTRCRFVKHVHGIRWLVNVKMAVNVHCDVRSACLFLILMKITL